MLQTIVDKLESLSSLTQALLVLVPALTGLIGWLHLRIRHQRHYLRLIHRLPRLRKYLAARKAAFAVLDSTDQMRFERVEGRIARELGLALHPDSVGLGSYLYPLDKHFLCRAKRQLASSVFAGFADDLIQWLIIVLDDMVDIQNQRRRSRLELDDSRHLGKLDCLHRQWREDMVRVERHIRLIQQFLAGQVEVDICPETRSRRVRSILIEKTEAYVHYCLEDRDRQRHSEPSELGQV